MGILKESAFSGYYNGRSEVAVWAQQFLKAQPDVLFHFTPTYSSWLNQVEIWFAKLQREVIERGIFTSVSDLRRKILRYIRLYGESAKPFCWKYSDPRHRIQPW